MKSERVSQRILFITEQKYDWVTDHVFHGLRDLGHEVIDFPPKPTYHLAPEKIDPVWHHNFPIKASLPVSKMPFRELRKTVENGHFDLILVDAKSFRLTPRPISNLIRHFKSRFRYNGERLGWRHLKRFSRPSGTVVAAIDGVDEGHLDASRARLLPFVDHYFKRELPPDPVDMARHLPAEWQEIVRTSQTKFHPIPIGINLTKFRESFTPEGKREYDVACMMDPRNHSLRTRAMEILREMTGEVRCRLHQGGGLDGKGVSRPDYFRALSASKLAVSIDGLGWDCIRHYEIPAAGAVLLVTEPSIRTHNFFRNDESCLFLKRDLSDLETKVRQLLNDPARIESIRANASQHLQQHLTHSAIARYVLDTCNTRTV